MTNEEYLIAFGKKVRRLREEHGYTMEELAKLCGYTSENSRSSIAKIEAGKCTIKQSRLERMADAFGISPAELIKVEENPNKKVQTYDYVIKFPNGKEVGFESDLVVTVVEKVMGLSPEKHVMLESFLDYLENLQDKES